MVRNVRKRPWFRIIRDLMATDVSMARIAKLCGKSGGASTVQHWADGGEPKDSDARIILALYRQHCPDKFDAHMREYEPEVLVYVKADNAIRARPKPKRVGVLPSAQFDFFVTEAA
jgi:hypothetical protein